MKTLALIQGDLALSSGSYLTFSGPDKIRQDLDLALNESYGSDLYHPYWGSVLTQYVGQPLTESARQAVISEVKRVLDNYVKVQTDQISADSVYDNLSGFTTSDVIRSIESVDAQPMQDRLLVTIVLVTMSNQTITIKRQVIS